MEFFDDCRKPLTRMEASEILFNGGGVYKRTSNGCYSYIKITEIYTTQRPWIGEK